MPLSHRGDEVLELRWLWLLYFCRHRKTNTSTKATANDCADIYVCANSIRIFSAGTWLRLRWQRAVKRGWKLPYSKCSRLFLQKVMQRPLYFGDYLLRYITPDLGNISVLFSIWFLVGIMDVHVNVSAGHAASGRVRPNRRTEGTHLPHQPQ